MSDLQHHNIVNLQDEEVIASIFREHYQSLVSFAMRYIQDLDLAEELVQDVFVRLWSDSEKIRISTSVKSYLLGAVRNAALNFLKFQKVRQDFATDQMKISTEQDQSSQLEYDELKEGIDLALQKLPEKCREIFELNRFEGKKYKEIAEELGLSLKTVENQMGKALKILRDELGEFLPIIIFLFFPWG